METGLDRQTIVRRSAGQVSCSIDDEIVALSVSKGSYFQMNEVGSVIWEYLETSVSVGDVCERLEGLFEVSAFDCERETLAFLRALRVAGLVEWDEVVAS